MLKYEKRKVEAAKALKGISNNDIAAAAGVTKQMVSKVIIGERNSKKVEAAIEELLQPELSEIIGRISEISPGTKLHLAGSSY